MKKNQKSGAIAIIPCAGSSTRMGGDTPKFFLTLGQTSVLGCNLKNLEACEDIAAIILVVSAHLFETFAQDILPQSPNQKIALLIEGGSERQHSVWHGFQALLGENSGFKTRALGADLPEATEESIVIVHDAARPLASPKLFSEVIEKAREKGAAIAAAPAQDTIKRCQGHQITETLDRTTLWQAQTPQGVKLDLLHQAFNRAYATDFLGTDEASLVENLGQTVYVVPAPKWNLKITTPEDLEIATALCEKPSKKD